MLTKYTILVFRKMFGLQREADPTEFPFKLLVTLLLTQARRESFLRVVYAWFEYC